MLEGLAWVTFRVTQDDVYVSEPDTGVVPLVCHYLSGPVRLKQVYLLEEYTEELASTHGIIPYGGVAFHRDKLQQWSDEIFGSWALPAGKVLESAQ